MRMRPEAEQLALFIKDLRQYHRAPEKEEKDEYDDVAREIEDLETDDEDYGNWTDGMWLSCFVFLSECSKRNGYGLLNSLLPNFLTLASLMDTNFNFSAK